MLFQQILTKSLQNLAMFEGEVFLHFISNSSMLESVIFQLPEMTGFFIFSLTENISISDTGLLKHYYWLNSYILKIFYLLYNFFYKSNW